MNKAVRTPGTKVVVTAGYFEGLQGTVVNTIAKGPNVMIETTSGNRLYFDSTDLDVVK